MAPLYHLLQQDVKWMWGNEQQSAFEEAKRHLCSPSVLAHYDPEKPLILSADASPYGIGAVLSHQIDGEEKPIGDEVHRKTNTLFSGNNMTAAGLEPLTLRSGGSSSNH